MQHVLTDMKRCDSIFHLKACIDSNLHAGITGLCLVAIAKESFLISAIVPFLRNKPS